MSNITKKFTSVALSVTTAVWLSGAAALVPVAYAQSTSLQDQINALLAQIAILQAQLDEEEQVRLKEGPDKIFWKHQ